MSLEAVTKVWARSRRKGSELLLLLAIADYAHDDLTGAHPSVDLLRKKTRMSERNVWLLIRKLQDAGELVMRANGGPHGETVYDIVVGEEVVFAGRARGGGSAKIAPKPTAKIAPPGTAKIAPTSAKIAPEARTGLHSRSAIQCQPRAHASVERDPLLDPLGEHAPPTPPAGGGEAAALFVLFCELTLLDPATVPTPTKHRQERVFAALLGTYATGDVAGCMRWLQSWRAVPWKPDTIEKEIDAWILDGRPANGLRSPPPPARTSSSGLVSRADGATYANGAHLRKRGKP